MAILNGILKKLNGSAGSLTFKQVNGQTVVSEKPSTVRNSRTPSQQRQRTKWGNVVQMYKGICPLINYGFESKPVGCSDYNMFMKTNMKLTDIYLTREEVAGGGCIAAPYQPERLLLADVCGQQRGDDSRVQRRPGLQALCEDLRRRGLFIPHTGYCHHNRQQRLCRRD